MQRSPEDFLSTAVALRPAHAPAPQSQAKPADDGVDKLADWLGEGPSFPPELLFPENPGDAHLGSFVPAHDPEAKGPWPVRVEEG